MANETPLIILNQMSSLSDKNATVSQPTFEVQEQFNSTVIVNDYNHEMDIIEGYRQTEESTATETGHKETNMSTSADYGNYLQSLVSRQYPYATTASIAHWDSWHLAIDDHADRVYSSRQPSHHPSMSYYDCQEPNDMPSYGPCLTTNYAQFDTINYKRSQSAITAPNAIISSPYLSTPPLTPCSPQRNTISVQQAQYSTPYTSPSYASSTTIVPPPFLGISKAVSPQQIEASKPVMLPPIYNDNSERKTSNLEATYHPCSSCLPSFSVSICCVCAIVIPVLLLSIALVGFFVDFSSII
ncbi:hypothetical protein BDF19DRAFT_462290 [Syncephalis fuscata]|nr:hypothetical protein BDF19DRAFT_462290 [Syncephalis fuscata]